MSGYQWPGTAEKEGYKFVPHAFAKLRRLPWVWCQRCGLLLLRNPRTDWCVQKGCWYDEHPGYRAAMRTR